ncbi:MAG: sigma-70 family RNA polymerase sigma factor [Bacteroidales bacterium]|nr:sigma-70 family RNA polymerase sigma factor [Bacteroidales bacterium]
MFRKYYKPLCFVAGSKTGDIHHAEDIVQELFADIYKRGKEIKLTTSIDRYLYGALFYKCSDYNKKKIHHDSIDDIPFDQKDTNSLPSDKLEEMELETEIFNTIDGLPRKCREVFMLSRFDNKKNKEIAGLLNLSEKTIETHISHALKKLKLVYNSYLKALILFLLY